MERQRSSKTDLHSFYGDYLYDQIVPKEHFLRKLKAIIEWEGYTRNLSKYFMGLVFDQKAPDHSTMTVFRARSVERGKIKIYEEILDEIIGMAQRSGNAVWFHSTDR